MFNIFKVIYNVNSINQAQGKVINFYKDNYLRTFFSIYNSQIKAAIFQTTNRKIPFQVASSKLHNFFYKYMSLNLKKKLQEFVFYFEHL